MAAFRHRRLVRFADCDPAGIVYFPRYFDMAHGAIEDWYREALGIDYWHFLRDRRIGFPIAHAEADFARPSTMGDELEFELLVERVGSRSLALRFVVWCGEERRLEGRIVCVLTSLADHASIAMPPELRAAYDRYVERCRPSA